VEDLRKRKAKISVCGYYKSSLGKREFHAGSNDWDVNVYFKDELPAPKVELYCFFVEIEVFGGIPGICNSDLVFGISEKSITVMYEHLRKKEMERIRDYLKDLGYRKIKFRRAL